MVMIPSLESMLATESKDMGPGVRAVVEAEDGVPVKIDR
jgi:hypothetical protein